MKKNKMNSKVKIPLIITGFNFATHLMPFVIILPLLIMDITFLNELEIDILGTIYTFLLLLSILIYIISVFLAPVIQFVLAIIAMINKKWWLVSVHIVSAIALFGGIVLFTEIFNRLVYAT